MRFAPISPKVREILKDSIKGRELVKEVLRRKPDKGGHKKNIMCKEDDEG